MIKFQNSTKVEKLEMIKMLIKQVHNQLSDKDVFSQYNSYLKEKLHHL
jgi:hypothetical protein